MASSHSYRSPSPPPSKHTDLRSANAENASSLRRSFSGGPSILKTLRRFDPVTPANSPSDFSARRSMCKESSGLSSSKDCEEKENDAKDHNMKACKLQSQAKGSKNFMSPTISASSKFTPSPRKKVLVERNDPVRTSMSLSNGKAVFFSNMSRRVCEDSELKSEMATLHKEETEGSLGINDGADSEKYEIVCEDPPLPKPVKRVTFSDVTLDRKHDPEPFLESVVADSDHPHVESSAKDKVSLSESGTSIAPLDADPLCPPYDPINNYLSPRPRFLHYKPNPRMEILSSGLEDSLIGEFIAENFSESESTEESRREDSSPKGEFEVVASADLVLGAEETEDDIFLVDETYESLSVNSSALSGDIISEKNRNHKPVKKPWAFSRSFFFFSMLLIVITASVWIAFIDPKALDKIVPKDLSISDLCSRSELIPSAVENINWLVNNVNQFSISSAIFMSKLVNVLVGSEKLGPLQLHYMNLTDLQKSPWVGNHFLDKNEVRIESKEKYDKYDRMEINVDGFEEEEASDVEFSFDEIFANEFQTPDGIPEEYEMFRGNFKNEKLCSDDIPEEPQDEIPGTDEMFHEVQEQVIVLSDAEQLREGNSQDESHAFTPLDQESVFVGSRIEEVPSAKTIIENIIGDVKNDDSSDCADDNELLDLSYSTGDIQTWTKMDPTPENLQEKPRANYAIAILSIFAAIFAVAAMLIRQKRSPSSNNVATEANHQLSSMKRHADQENAVSEMMGDSEMSSFLQQKTASFSSTKREEMSRSTSEVQAHERKANSSSLRRESLASSEFSMSPSYGSFTSYEKADGEEKFLTPVRRSSRIRNRRQTQITSS